MIVAAHQPSYLPWLGYLAKMAEADLFVVMDDLQYESQNFQNRNRVKINHGTQWLTVPLQKGSRSEVICDKRINNQGSPRQHWQRRHWVTLETHYRRSPFFSRYADQLREVFTARWHRLIDLDMAVLGLARQWLEISTPIRRSSELGLRGQKTDLIRHLCRQVGADTYLSGRGGSTGYLDVALLEAVGVQTQWQCFEHPTYSQRYPELGFIPNLAFLDLVFNCGPRSAQILRDSFHTAPSILLTQAS